MDCCSAPRGQRIPRHPPDLPLPPHHAMVTQGAVGIPRDWDCPGPQGNDVQGKGIPHTPDPLLQVDDLVFRAVCSFFSSKKKHPFLTQSMRNAM